MSENNIRAKNISKRFNDIYLFSDLTINFSYGNLILRHGENGVGKSTLMKVLLGIIKSDTGTQHYLSNNQYKSFIGYSSSNQNTFFNRLTVTDNLLFFLMLRGYDKKNSLKIVKEILIDFDLDNSILSKKFMHLSSGERKIISIIRSIAHKPSIYFFDEPLSGLDKNLTSKFFDFLYKKKELKNACIYVITHQISKFKDLYDISIELKKDGSHLIQENINKNV